MGTANTYLYFHVADNEPHCRSCGRSLLCMRIEGQVSVGIFPDECYDAVGSQSFITEDWTYRDVHIKCPCGVIIPEECFDWEWEDDCWLLRFKGEIEAEEED